MQRVSLASPANQTLLPTFTCPRRRIFHHLTNTTHSSQPPLLKHPPSIPSNSPASLTAHLNTHRVSITAQHTSQTPHLITSCPYSILTHHPASPPQHTLCFHYILKLQPYTQPHHTPCLRSILSHQPASPLQHNVPLYSLDTQTSHPAHLNTSFIWPC